MERRVGASWIGGRCVVSVFGAVVAIVLVFGGASGARAGNDVRPAAESIARGPQVARSQGDVCLPGTTAGDLSRMFDAEPGGLVGADYQRPYPLPDGRVLWLFQDGAVRVGPDQITIVHSVAMVQDGRCFSVWYGGTRSAPTAYLLPNETVPFERWYWPLDAEMGSDGLLYIFVAEMRERGEEYLSVVEPTATRVVAFDPASDAIVTTGLPGDAGAALYGWSIASDEQWTYLYAQCYRQFGYDVYIFTAAFDRSCATRITVARVPRGRLLDRPAYWDGISWQADPARAVAVIETDGRRVNADQIEFTGSSFFSVNKEGDWWGDTIYFARAERASGPFVVYDTVLAPVKCIDCNSFFASWVPRQAADRPASTFVFGLAHNRWDGVITALYRPTFHEVPAPPHLAGGDTLRVDVSPGATAVVMNVTSTRSQDVGYVTAHPCDRERPVASSLNYPAGVTTGNLVVARPDAAAQVCLFSRSTTDLVVDSMGSFAGGFVPQDTPTRLVDTRLTSGGSGRVGAGEVLRVRVPGGLDSAVLNVTSVEPVGPGYITAYPCDRERPLASSLNLTVGQVVGNLVVSRVGATGEVCLYVKAATHVIVDLAGGFAADGGFVPSDAPIRLADTRATAGAVPAGGVLRVAVPAGSGSAVLNVTADRPRSAGHVTAYPCDRARPVASSLNVAAGAVRGNLVIVRPDPAGEICLFTSTAAELVVDLAGVFDPADEGGFVPEDAPVRVVDTRTGLGLSG